MPPDGTSQGIFTSSKGIVTFFILVKISSVNIISNDEFTNAGTEQSFIRGGSAPRSNPLPIPSEKFQTNGTTLTHPVNPFQLLQTGCL